MRPKIGLDDFFCKRRGKPPKVRAIRRGLSRCRLGSAARRFAASFAPDRAGIGEMVLAVSRFRMVESRFLSRLYGARTAEDIIATGMVPTIMKKSPRGNCPQLGCADLVDALSAALRAKRIPARHLRSIANIQKMLRGAGGNFAKWLAENEIAPHSYSIFSFGGKAYLADPFAEKPVEMVLELGEPLKQAIDFLKKNGLARQGRDMWDPKIGLYSYRDYAAEKKRFNGIRAGFFRRNSR